jgi:NhaA family Na+:H+ antiporter
MSMQAPMKAIQEFLELESATGILLIAAAVLALLAANSPLADLYAALLQVPFEIRLGEWALAKPLLLWINDGLMAVFFLLVGLEIKREILEGELSSREQALLPVIAAAGGMLVPALIYVMFNYQDPVALSGWAIPSATDIAFALGILALLGERAPTSLKIFLLAIAIIDDLGAIAIIALFYSGALSLKTLLLALFALVVLVALNLRGVTNTAAYVLVGILLWIFVLKSGVHATLAGVALALTIPLRVGADNEGSPLRRFEHALHPWVAFGILPVFAFANAGVSLEGLKPDILLEPVTLGIILGLFVGKQIGVFGATWLTVKLGIARLPEESGWLQVYGVAALCGIGFTMSLFIGSLAFEHTGVDYSAANRLGILCGSLLSAVAGYLLLRITIRSR